VKYSWLTIVIGLSVYIYFHTYVDKLLTSKCCKLLIFDITGMMAGIGIGMFLLGCVLGTILSCIFFRRKQTLKPPFHHDTIDDYRDETDLNNAL